MNKKDVVFIDANPMCPVILTEDDDPYCPRCGSNLTKYWGWEDTEVYECLECSLTFGVVNPNHT